MTPGHGRRYAGILARIVAVGAAGFLLGGLTSPAQQYLPDAVHSFANSSSGWVLLTVGLAALSRLSPLPAAYAGSLAMVLMVEGYGVVSALRGFPNGPPLTGLFTIAGLLVGFLLGAATAVARSGPEPWRTLAIAPFSAVLVGEGIVGLTALRATTSPVYWTAVVVLGVVALAAWLIVRRPRWTVAVATVLLVAGGAAAFAAVYTLPIDPRLPVP